jgi:hypothetical protein
VSARSHGFAPTSSAARYVQQLIKHWSHKYDCSYVDGVGEVPFSEGVHARFEAKPEGIHVQLVAPDMAQNERVRGAIERHLDRFAFREAPLDYRWEVQP